MHNIFRLAIRNLRRNTRRSILIVSLIVIGVVFVQGYVAATNSYKSLIIGQITDAMLGHIQIHKKGYLISIENVPLNMNLQPSQAARAEEILKSIPEVEAYSTRIKLAGMLSNYVETTNIRLSAVLPSSEFKTATLLPSRIIAGVKDVKEGEMLAPELLAKGLKLKVGDPVVLVATNKDGSVNGKQFTVGGIVETAPGPGGRDGYIHFNDAVELLRMQDREVSEIALRVRRFDQLDHVLKKLSAALSQEMWPDGKPVFEVHGWQSLSPFANVARMIDIMTVFVKLILIAIVLISIMNAMIMSVYERTREIGTLAAIGTLPNTILMMFMAEGLCLGVTGVVVGDIISVILIYALRLSHFTFAFGMREGFVLMPEVSPWDFLWVSAIVLVVSVAGSIQPAYKASKLEPIKALKSI